MPKGKFIPYSAEEMAWLEANRALSISQYHAAFVAAFARDDIEARHLHALRKRKGWKTGRTGYFEAGQEAHNKGRRCAPGEGGRHPNAARNYFKTGHRGGRAAQVYQPVGAERVMDGYLQRKVNDDMPFHRRWRAVQLINWEAVNGPVPKGYVLKCLDGDRMNVAPANWEAVPRGLLPRLNGGRHKRRMAFDEAAPELKPTLMAIAKVEQAAHEVRKS